VGHGRYVPTGSVGVGVQATAGRAPRLALQLGLAAVTAALEMAADALVLKVR
jgi:hypothetical protein